MTTLGYIHDTLGTITDIRALSQMPRDLIQSCPVPFICFFELDKLAADEVVVKNKETGEVLNFKTRQREIRAFLRTLSSIQLQIEIEKYGQAAQ